jgi:hypothetical protein
MKQQLEKLTTQNIYFREEQSAIPFDLALKTINLMEYASLERVGFILLFLSGARVCELDRMSIDNLSGNELLWRPAKNQFRSRPRKAILPMEFLTEISEMRRKFGATKTILPINSHTFRRYFTKLRHKLGGEWLERLKTAKGGRVTLEYKYQLKGLRKLFATKVFFEKMKQFNSAECALLFACKELRHSSNKMTADHYLIEDVDKLGITKYLFLDYTQIMKLSKQTRLIDFGIGCL